MKTAAAEALLRGFVPAFRDQRDGETHLACDAVGRPSLHHRIDGLPDRWISERDDDGTACALHPSIQAGLRRGTEFIVLSARLDLPLDG